MAEDSDAGSKGCISGTCFVAGTLVTMADGSLKPIEQIREGDRVLSKDEVSGKDEAKKVTHAFSKHATLVLSLHLSNGETLEATGDHPFYVQGKGWTPARECGIGTSIVTRAGPSVQVKSVDRHERDETVFNLTVEDDYSFFVGKTGAWTHNAGDCPRGYTNVFEVQLTQAQMAKGEKGHFGVSNRALDEAFAANPGFADAMEELIPGVKDAVSRVGGRSNPPGYTWHHALREQARGRIGVMQLVPQTQHNAPGWGSVLHPQNRGGYTEWAIDAGARLRVRGSGSRRR